MEWGGLGFVGYKLYPYYRLYELKDTRVLKLKSNEKKAIFIPIGAKLKQVTELLNHNVGLKNPEDFSFFANAKHYEGRRIVPGKYRVSGAMTYNKLVNHLRAGNGRLSVKVSFHYLKDLKELAGKVSAQIYADGKRLYKMLSDPKVQEKYGFDKKTFKLMFLPDTYRFNWACDARCFIERMAKEYRKFWRGKNGRKAKKLGLSHLQVATLASLVQAEQSVKPDEWPKIAGLYINRLKRDMKLEADPTVKFALGQPGLRRILFKHLKVDSPYNTYKYKGLPPGPLNWPEKRAILATLNYAKHDYIYMCAKPEYSGYHNFSKTAKQHQRYAKMYHRWLKKEGIR